MIIGFTEFNGLFRLLEGLELSGGELAFGADVANFIVIHGKAKAVLWDSMDTSIDDEFGNPTYEELDVLAMFDDRWIDDVILEEDGETDS